MLKLKKSKIEFILVIMTLLFISNILQLNHSLTSVSAQYEGEIGSASLEEQLEIAREKIGSAKALGINWTDQFTRPEFYFCGEQQLSENVTNQQTCYPTINVLYESPTLVILDSEYSSYLWKAVDEVKNTDFEINGFENYFTELPINDSKKLSTTVVLSK